MGALGTRPSFSGLEAWVSGCGFAQLPNHLTTEPPNQRLGTDPKFPVCVTLPRRSIVRERAGSAARAKRQGRCDGCIFMAGIISKSGRRGKRDLAHPCDDAHETRRHALRQCPRISLEIYSCWPRSTRGATRRRRVLACLQVVSHSASCQRTTLLRHQKRSRSTLYLTLRAEFSEHCFAARLRRSV